MKVLLQRVARAEVRVGGRSVARIGRGLLALVGVERGDRVEDAFALADKTADLRIFADARGRLDRSLVESAGDALVVSQFTLVADTRRGRRPSFDDAAPPAVAAELCEHFANRLAARTPVVERGQFGADMQVELVNDGPVTIWLSRDPARRADDGRA